MKRIVLLTTDSRPQIGGVADYLEGLMKATDHVAEWRMYSTIKGSKNYRCFDRNPGRMRGDFFPPIRKLNTLRWKNARQRVAHYFLEEIVKRDQPDVVLIGRWCEMSHFWCVACKEQGIPYSIIAYGMELLEETKWPNLRKQDFGAAEKVICISQSTKNYVLDFEVFEDRVVLLPPGIDPARYPKIAENKARSLLAFQHLSDTPYILSLGRLIKRKGFDLLVDAFEKICDTFPNVALVIAGDGEEREPLEQLLREKGLEHRVRLLGEVDEECKKALYQHCLFFVLANRLLRGDMEGFGIVFLEAGLYGKAVIGGNNGGVPDAVCHEETGLLVKTENDTQEIATALHTLLNDEDLATRLGSEGKRRAINHFDWNQLGEKFNRELSNSS